MNDAIVVGAGHNGLVAAFSLARSGVDVTVVEGSDTVGGACKTEELVPGYRFSTCANYLEWLRPNVAADMRLFERSSGGRTRSPEASDRGVLGAGRDGMGRLTETMRAAAEEAGATIVTGCPVERIEVEDGRVDISPSQWILPERLPSPKRRAYLTPSRTSTSSWSRRSLA